MVDALLCDKLPEVSTVLRSTLVIVDFPGCRAFKQCVTLFVQNKGQLVTLNKNEAANVVADCELETSGYVNFSVVVSVHLQFAKSQSSFV